MSDRENYNGNKNDVQSKLYLVKQLNEILSIENAAAVRIASRIDQTSIQEVKQILKRHLNDTNIHKNRLQKIISRLGGESTNAKADLSLSFVSTTMTIENNFPENIKIKAKENGLELSLPEEYELVQMRQDFAINHNEMVAYESLIGKMQMTNIPYQQEFLSLLEKSMKEQESMVY